MFDESFLRVWECKKCLTYCIYRLSFDCRIFFFQPKNEAKSNVSCFTEYTVVDSRQLFHVKESLWSFIGLFPEHSVRINMRVCTSDHWVTTVRTDVTECLLSTAAFLNTYSKCQRLRHLQTHKQPATLSSDKKLSQCLILTLCCRLHPCRGRDVAWFTVQQAWP